MTFKPSAKKQLEKAHAAHAAVLVQITDREAARNAALLAGEEAAAIATIDTAIAALKHATRTESDRVELLKVEVEKEEGLQRAARRALHIGRVKQKLSEADAVGIEAQAVADKLVKLFRKECEMRLALAAMWPWSSSDRNAIGLSGVAVRERYMHFFCKIGATLNAGGGLPVDRMTPSFPGGLCPRLEWRLLPEKIPSMTDVMREKSEYAARVLDAGKVANAPDPTVAAPQHNAAEGELAELHRQMAIAANDVSPAGEVRYRAIVEQITALSYQIAATDAKPRPAA